MPAKSALTLLLLSAAFAHAQAPLGQTTSTWRWSWTSATGSGDSLVKLYPDGTAASDTQGRLEKGTWIRRGEDIWIDWGLGSRMGDHYLYKVRISPDGLTMAFSPSMPNGNYYVRSLRGVSLDAGPPPAPSPAAIDISGTWQSNARDLGVSTWRFQPLGSGRYRAENGGLGSASGTAVVTSNRVRVDWQTVDRWVGYIDLTLDASGSRASGITFVTASPNGTTTRQDTSMTRIGGLPVPPPPPPVPSTSFDVSGTWQMSTKDVGPSTWRFQSQGNGRYTAVQEGAPNATGSAVVFNNRVRIDWQGADRTAGFVDLMLDPVGALATGVVYVTSSPTGATARHDTTLTRVDPAGGKR